MSFFEKVDLLPPDPIFSLPAAFKADPRADKVNLGIGTYRDAHGYLPLLSCVKKAEEIVISQEANKEYLPIEGMPEVIKGSAELIFGSDFLDEYGEAMFSTQTVGGTSALRIGGNFLFQQISKMIYIPDPSWPNHQTIFSHAGMKIKSYRYYGCKGHCIDFDGMCQDVKKMPPRSVILLHVCCHNPTGMDLSILQWKELSFLIQSQHLIPFFDFAYQGFGENLVDDAYPVRYFAAQGHEMLVAHSFSKNLGLYGERVGSLHAVTHGKGSAIKVGSHIKQIIRSTYSNPPRLGAQIAAEIFKTKTLKNEWLNELAGMRDRIKAMRTHLRARLQNTEPTREWNFLDSQKGLFSFCGFNLDQTQRLIYDYGIYMPIDGRINIAGLNENNIDYVVQAISHVLH